MLPEHRDNAGGHGEEGGESRLGGFFSRGYSRLTESGSWWRSGDAQAQPEDALHTPIHRANPDEEMGTLPPPPPTAGAAGTTQQGPTTTPAELETVAPAATDAAPVAPAEGAGAAAAAAPPPVDAMGEQDLRRMLLHLMTATKTMAFLTLWQILAAARTERIQLLTLLSLLVPWAGFEGAKERNRALLSVFNSLCWVYIPINVFHAYAHAQTVQSLLADDMYSDAVKSEIRASGSAFLGVSILIIIDMVMCIFLTRYIMRTHLLLLLTQHEHALNEFAVAQMATHGGATSGLPASDLAVLETTTIEHVDANKDVCVICQDNFVPGEVSRRLPCTHDFHAACVDLWFQRSSLCPICNANVHVLLVQAHATGDAV